MKKNKRTILRKIYPLLYVSIKVVDLQNEEAKEERANGSLNSNSVRVEPPAVEAIEEEPKEEQPLEIANEVVEEKMKNLQKNPKKKKSNLNPNHFHKVKVLEGNALYPKQNQKQVI